MRERRQQGRWGDGRGEEREWEGGRRKKRWKAEEEVEGERKGGEAKEEVEDERKGGEAEEEVGRRKKEVRRRKKW